MKTHTDPFTGTHERAIATATTTTVVDPVCGVRVDPGTAAGSLDHAGTTHFFCSTHCLERFRSEPEQFSGGRVAVASHACCGKVSSTPAKHDAHDVTAASVSHARNADAASLVAAERYTCPMHPEIVQDGPGDCPICGMPLEPMLAAADDGPSDEERDMRRRLLVSGVFAAPVIFLAMADMIPSLGFGASPLTLSWLQLALTLPVVVWGAADRKSVV